jgi:hypothetical protein
MSRSLCSTAAAAYARVSRLQTVRGRFIQDWDVEQAARVCVLGAKVKRLMFPLRDAVGETISLSNQEFRVVGVLEERRVAAAGDSLALADINEDIYLPITTAMDYFPIYLEQAMPPDADSLFQAWRRLAVRPPLDQRSITSVRTQDAAADI